MEQKKHIKPCLQSAKIAIPADIQMCQRKPSKSILHSPPMAPPIPRRHGIANLALGTAVAAFDDKASSLSQTL